MAETPSVVPLPAAWAARLSGWLTHLGVSPLAFDDTLSLINPLLTVNSLHARIVARTVETPSATTFVLQAGLAFAGLRPGQYVMVGVTINGVRHRRAYSARAVDGPPGRFAITVQRQPGGLVSNYLNDSAVVGQIIEIEQAKGDFTLPSTVPPELLLIAGGSGITPHMAMLNHIRWHAPRTRVTLIYYARSRDDRIFAKALDSLAADWPSLRYVPIDSVANTPTDEPGRTTATAVNADSPSQTLDHALLTQWAPNWRALPTYCCGPAPLMDATRMLWQSSGIAQRLHLEAFAPPKPSGDPHARHRVCVTKQAVPLAFEAQGDQTILVAAEAAGQALKHGCRQGICHECTCRLSHGSVRDLLTGERIDGEGQTIRVCVSTPMSDLELEALN
jgi:ferredoxin-NADP reductase